MAQVKEQNPAQAQNNPNRNSESGGEKRTRTRRPYYNRRPRRTQQPKEAAVPIHIYPLGGLGEVGKNMTVYECNGDMIIVDCGLVFPDSEMYGVDMVIPDFTFVVQNKDKIKGLLITHGHEDHIGSIPYLLQKFDLPIYGTRLTCGLIRNKLEEFGLAGKTKFVEITPKQKIKLGCFTVEPIHVNHSIPDSVAFAIDSPAGTIIQTGDFKIDYTPLACGVTDLTTLSEYGQKGVLALLSDSTNAERPGFTATEQKVAAGVRNLFARARNKRIIIATFASNIYRVQQIIDLAVEDGRKVAFSGRSMVNNTAMAQELGYMHIPEGTLISVDELNQYPPEHAVVGTQLSHGIHTDEAVSVPRAAKFRGFKNECAGTSCSKAFIESDRSQRISQKSAHNRNHTISLISQFVELFATRPGGAPLECLYAAFTHRWPSCSLVRYPTTTGSCPPSSKQDRLPVWQAAPT